MIKFFRQIRLSFISENETGKYFKYAIGEIILVVIGILIALQINNWNVNNNTRNTEIKLLRELKEDLLKTKEDLLTDIDKSTKILAATDAFYLKIVKARENNTDVTLTISNTELSDTPLLFPKLSAYESIQSYGVNIISNDSLRKSLTELYELQIARVKFVEAFIGELHQTEIREHLYNLAEPENLCEECVSLKEQFTEQNNEKNVFILSNPNTEFVHLLKRRYAVVKVVRNRYLTVNDQIDHMIKIIDEEIADSHD